MTLVTVPACVLMLQAIALKKKSSLTTLMTLSAHTTFGTLLSVHITKVPARCSQLQAKR